MVQRAKPMVWPPDRAVMSWAVRPLAAKAEMRAGRAENGEGIWVFAAAWLVVVASLRPSGTSHVGPPSRTTPSLAAMARISAQDTVLLQAASTRVLIVSMTSNPLAEFRFGNAFFSPVKVGVSSRSIDASQPLTKQSWKNNRRIEAPSRSSLSIACLIATRTMPLRLGQVVA